MTDGSLICDGDVCIRPSLKYGSCAIAPHSNFEIKIRLPINKVKPLSEILKMTYFIITMNLKQWKRSKIMGVLCMSETDPLKLARRSGTPPLCPSSHSFMSFSSFSIKCCAKEERTNNSNLKNMTQPLEDSEGNALVVHRVIEQEQGSPQIRTNG